MGKTTEKNDTEGGLHHDKVSATIVSMKMSFRIGKVEHAANMSFGLGKSKGFHFVVVAGSGIPLFLPLADLLNPSKKKQTVQKILPSDLRSNIYNNQMEYQIYFIYY